MTQQTNIITIVIIIIIIITIMSDGNKILFVIKIWVQVVDIRDAKYGSVLTLLNTKVNEGVT
jgi:hypothetical protein